MKRKKESPLAVVKSENSGQDSTDKEGEGFGGLNSEISRRTFLKASVTTAAVVGVTTAVVTKGGTSVTAASQQQATSTDPFASQEITLNVNGVDYPVTVEPRDMLVNVIREDIGLIGTKRGCNRMECGACTVLIDGTPFNACNFLAVRAAGKKILTTEGGVASTAKGAPAPDPVISSLHSAFVTNDGGQCGFCSPGQIMAAAALLKKNANPSVDEIKASQAGSLCRCGNYPNIIASIQLAAQSLQGGQ